MNLGLSGGKLRKKDIFAHTYSNCIKSHQGKIMKSSNKASYKPEEISMQYLESVAKQF